MFQMNCGTFIKLSRNYKKPVIHILLLAGVALPFQNCGKQNFSSNASGPGAAQAAGALPDNLWPRNTCDLRTVSGPVKVMFVVDVSGSNAGYSKNDGTISCDPKKDSCSPPTDPNKVFRGGSISDFFQKYRAKTNFSWGFEVFAGTAAKALINGFGNAAAMASAISKFESTTDVGATPFVAALTMAKSAIQNDPDLKSQTAPPIYSIVFVSDGQPTDIPQDNLTAADKLIQSMLELAPGRVALSTVYYGTIKDVSAADALKAMATTGNGYFVNIDTTSTSTIQLENLVAIPTEACM